MSTPSDFACLEAHKRPRIIWDPTVNLSVILGAAMLSATGFAAWVSVKETQAAQASKHEALSQRVDSQDSRIKEQDARTRETLLEIKSDVKDVRRRVEDMNLSIVRSNRP